MSSDWAVPSRFLSAVGTAQADATIGSSASTIQGMSAGPAGLPQALHSAAIDRLSRLT
ncbi:MAG: hypothetical protein AVDCRST_MAG93-4461 [uncultured Chloroflexia bacterium]|uniref:Uncharacterized protein n=1 Tax=uncultured Chloroflexia bacterium TaxID=1672391 RepID=A0A6J4K9J1_9CHLR|nr:MAG: hypothetical protein AVDCRST_MAG93-4461 [uncultured Chloroflexia bacterium]